LAKSSIRVPDGQGNFSFYLCLSPASGSCTDAYTNSAGFGALPLSFGGSFGRTAYNYGDTTLRLRWETKAAIDNSWLQAAPVPEPASWAMLLGGLTILGATGARRRRYPGRRAERP
jgi:hypothetical protein